MSTDVLDYGLYVVTWLSFGVGHSVLALPGVRKALGARIGARYRFAYNVVASVHLAIVLAVGWLTLGDREPFALPYAMQAAMVVVSLAGLAVLAATPWLYDVGRFGGVAQWKAARAGTPIAEDEPLRRDGLHRYVRHPLYSAGFLVLWGIAWSPLGLATAVCGSAYLVVGTALEERKLVALDGDDYRRYRDAVPAFVPRPGRVWRQGGDRKR